MWKVGDRIRFIKEGDADSTKENGFVIGDTYEIIKRTEIEFDDNGHLQNEDEQYYDDGNGYKFAIKIQDYNTWWVEPYSFEKITKKKAKNEMDVLDNIQYNFKHGF